MSTEPPTELSGEDHIYLLSRSSLDDYLSFMAAYPVNAQELDRNQTADDWRQAAALMDELRQSEPTWADDAKLSPLPPAMRRLVKHVQDDPIFTKAYSDAPVEFGMVELDRLVVSQKLVCVDHLSRLQQRLDPDPSPEQLFRFCLPFEHNPPECRAGRVSDEMFAFVSDSADLRFLEAVMLRPEQIRGYQAMGPIAGVVALVVGYGSNYLNVISAKGRLILNNGHHRACALRHLGLTHVPCAVQRATRAEEFEVLAPRAVRRNPDFYLEQPRPPALKDYFDGRLGKKVRLAMTTKEVRLTYSVEELDLP
ncbi:MAG: hypothetical protein ACJ8F7_05550 [Gemmataceae bacterium]